MGNTNSFDPNRVFDHSISNSKWTTASDMVLNSIDPIDRSDTEKLWRQVVSLVPILNEIETIEHGAEIHCFRQIEQHRKHKEDFRKVMPEATEKCLDVMAAVTNGAIEPLAASIIIKKELKKKK